MQKSPSHGFHNQNQNSSNETPTRRLTRAKTACVRVVRVRSQRHPHAPYFYKGVCVCLGHEGEWKIIYELHL